MVHGVHSQLKLLSDLVEATKKLLTTVLSSTHYAHQLLATPESSPHETHYICSSQLLLYIGIYSALFDDIC